VGNFPLAYVYPKEMRATRDLLRRRTKMVMQAGNLKAHTWILGSGLYYCTFVMSNAKRKA